jgi:hypothetical protein
MLAIVQKTILQNIFNPEFSKFFFPYKSSTTYCITNIFIINRCMFCQNIMCNKFYYQFYDLEKSKAKKVMHLIIK